MLILDVSGFTALGERLKVELGVSEGAAKLAEIVDRMLGGMVNLVTARRGDVVRFAGDALICIFEGQDRDVTMRNVKQCCCEVVHTALRASGLTSTGAARLG